MKKMFNEFDNVRNPMLGAYLLWNFVLGYFSEKNDANNIFQNLLKNVKNVC